MIKQVYPLFILLFLAASVICQTPIMSEDFEDATINYTTSHPECSDGETDYFIRTNGSNIGAGVSLSNVGGSSFFGAQDFDEADCTNSNTVSLTFVGINITNYSDLALDVKIAEDDDGGSQDWDGDSYMHISASIDGGAAQNLIWVESVGGTNTEPAIDTDFDGVGDGTTITSAFQNFSANISGTGSSITITIEFNDLNAGDEDIAIDDVVLSGTEVSSDTRVQFSAATSTLAENGLFLDIPVSITSPSASAATTVEVSLTGGTATNGSDYDDGGMPASAISFPVTLTFPANSSSDQNFSVFISNDDAIFEGDETVILALQNPSGGTNATLGSITSHTLTIQDNDLPSLNQIRINETNCTPAGSEFIELFSQLGASLDGLVIVHFNGNGNTSLWAYDLDGITISSGGYYVLCENSNTNGYCDEVVGVFDALQDGPDAVAIYVGDASDFPNGTAATSTNLVDAIVYDTNDGDDDILGILGINEPAQQNEDENNSSLTHSVQRGSLFTAPETPKAANMPLPVELINFNVNINDKKQVELKWTTATEIHNLGYEILKSADGQKWEQIGWVEGAGNSYDFLRYEYLDNAPFDGMNYYRLAQIDFTGRIEYHAVASVNLREKNRWVNIFPTNAENHLDIEFNEAFESEVEILIYDNSGKTMDNISAEQLNDSKTRMNISNLVPGNYFIKIVVNNSVETYRFMKL